MKNKGRIGVKALASLLLAGTLCALPPAGNAQSASTNQQEAGQTQSVSGKIASIDRTSFTLTVTSSRMLNQSRTTPREDNAAKTMTFQVDENTTIDGKLQVGANADVTYRQEGGTSVAISVRVGS